MLSLLSQAWQSWKHAKTIALLAIVAFAVGIGSTTAIYTVVNTVMLGPLPYPDGDRFVVLYGGTLEEPDRRTANTYPDLQEYQERTTSFDAFGWFRHGSFNLTAPGQPRQVNAALVTPSLVHGLGVNPAMGYWFTDETGAVLSYALWQRLGAEPNLVGQGMTLDARRLTITGVMPATFRLPVPGIGSEGFETDVWIYLDPLGRGQARDDGLYFGYARRKPGITLARAQGDVEAVGREIAKRNPVSHASYVARLDDLRETTISGIRPTLLLLFSAAGLLLAITCANVAGLLLARSVARARETATRVALGASARQLGVHYFVEGVLVWLAGAVAGLLVSIVLVRIVMSIAADDIPRADEIGVDWAVLLFALSTAFAAGTLSSLAPLWQAARTVPNDVLSDGVRTSASARIRALSRSLVIAEIATAFTLLVVSAVLIAHMRTLTRTSPGFDPDGLLTFGLTLPEAIAAREDTRVAQQKRLIEALQAIPGVSDASFVSHLPLDGCCFGGTIHPEGRTIDPDAPQRNSFLVIDPGYFRTMRIPLRKGRFLDERDARKDLLVVAVNEAAAARYWPDRDPVNAYGRLSAPDGPRVQIAGVVGDVRDDGLNRPSVPEVYLLNSAVAANSLHFVVRSPRPADSLVAEVRRAVQRVDPTWPVHDVATMSQIVRKSLVLERVGSLMLTFFALAALLMATLGVYGLVSYAVRQRRVEIGTRMALGAVNRDLWTLVVGGGLKMAAWGVAVGGIGVVGAVWLLVRFFEIRDVGILPFVSSTAMVASIAAAASAFPAWRATRLSPMVAIRDEPQSLWQSARGGIRRAITGISQAVPSAGQARHASDGPLLTDFVAAARRADSAAAALHTALAAVRSFFDAESILLLEKVEGREYRCTATAPERTELAAGPSG